MLLISGIGKVIKQSIEKGIIYTKEEIVEKCSKKGSLMFEFLYKYKNNLSLLISDPISQPLVRCKDMVESQV